MRARSGGQQTILEEFAVGRAANDAQLKTMKSHTIDFLMDHAASHLSLR
jgi:hypothetical protein